MQKLTDHLTGITRRSDMKLTRIATKVTRATMTTGQLVTILVLSTPVLSCNLLNKGLEATAPDKIETSTLEIPANAGLIVNSAIGNFECALKAYIVDAAMASGEFMDATPMASTRRFRWHAEQRTERWSCCRDGPTPRLRTDRT